MDDYYKHRYYKYKSKYLNIKNRDSSSHGGKKTSKKNNLVTIQNTYSLTTNAYSDHDVIILGKIRKIKNFKKVGKMRVTADLVVGDTDYTVVDNMKKGIYNVYLVDDNLVVVHESHKPELSVEELEQIVFKYSGVGVGVDSGSFGFYDSGALSEIITSNDIPNIFFNENKLDKILKNNFYGVTISDLLEARGETYYPERLVKLTSKAKDKILNKYTDNVGFIAQTITGDGGFDCYINNNDIAILIGGITQEILVIGLEAYEKLMARKIVDIKILNDSEEKKSANILQVEIFYNDDSTKKVNYSREALNELLKSLNKKEI